MKLAMLLRSGCLLLALSACGGPHPDETVEAGRSTDSGWARTPDIQAVSSRAGALTITGTAEPGARVVLRSANGSAYAAGADNAGRFEIRIAPAQDVLLLRPETQTGQAAAVSPDLLLVLEGGAGPAALLRPGGSARRLDDAPALGAVDSDSRSVVASGHTRSPDQPFVIVVGDREVGAEPGPDGSWSLLLVSGAPGPLRIGEDTFQWPGPGASNADFVVEPLKAGWRVGWTSQNGARQWTWLPVRSGT